MKSGRQPAVAWQREPFVWLVIAIPMCAVVVGFVLLALSLTSYDGLVTDDYYRRGKEINRVLARDHFATDHNLSAGLTFDSGAERLTITLSGGVPPGTPTLQFLHPTREGMDRTVQLIRESTSTFGGTLPALSNGRWIVQLGTEQWRLVTTIGYPVHEVSFAAGTRDAN